MLNLSALKILKRSILRIVGKLHLNYPNLHRGALSVEKEKNVC